MSPATPPASIKAPSISLPRVTAICMTAEDAPRSRRIGPKERFMTAVLTSFVRLASTQAAKSHQRYPSCVVAAGFVSIASALIADAIQLIFTGTCEKCKLFGIALLSHGGAVGTNGRINQTPAFFATVSDDAINL